MNRSHSRCSRPRYRRDRSRRADVTKNLTDRDILFGGAPLPPRSLAPPGREFQGSLPNSSIPQFPIRCPVREKFRRREIEPSAYGQDRPTRQSATATRIRLCSSGDLHLTGLAHRPPRNFALRCADSPSAPKNRASAGRPPSIRPSSESPQGPRSLNPSRPQAIDSPAPGRHRHRHRPAK